jgi:hypothetical protein
VRTRSYICICLALVSASIATAQESPSIVIEEIIQGDHISGTVTGLTSNGASSHKVVVYVRTNHWYIHPYAQGGNGKSWAVISSDGKWTIETVRRQFSASSVAALVVPIDANTPAEAESVRAIPKLAIIVQSLEGTPNYGKL